MQNLKRCALFLIFILSALLFFGAPHVTHASANLVADYRFNGSHASSVGSAPDLADIGSNSFAADTVDSVSCNVLTFSQGNGLSLATNGLISSDTYSIVMLFRFDNTSSYRKLVDFKNGTEDYGLYNFSQKLRFYTDASGANVVFQDNTYAQVVLTRDGTTKQVTGYVDGAQEIQFTDTNDRALIDSSNTLRFLIDDTTTGGVEASAGAVARIRIYDGVLSSGEVSALDRTHGDCNGPSVITIQNNNAAVTYQNWQGVNDAGASGGSYRQNKTTAGKAVVKFSGTQVQYRYLAAPYMGKADVYIDGVKKQTLCLYAASPTFKSKTFKNLASGKHKLEIRVLNQTCKSSTDAYVSIDKIVAGATTREDDALQWSWNGWKGKADSAANGGSYHFSKTNGAAVTLTFHGTGIQVLTLKGPSFGKMDVTIDNAFQETIDLSNATVTVYLKSYSGLSDADHTIVLSRNASSGSNPIVLDGFRGAVTLP